MNYVTYYLACKVSCLKINELYKLFLKHPSIETDTRKIKPGDIFFALKGPNFNANLFATKALELGASFAVVDEKPENDYTKIILVDNVLSTLQQLAAYHRDQFHIPFVAVTGSNGKTTTKELLHAVLSAHFLTYTTRGNLNNHIGIPLTLLSIKQDAELAIIEMGANHLYEIQEYCTYTKPTHGIITNCGKAHIEGFGSLENVRKGKGELFEYLAANNGTAFLFDDHDYLNSLSKGIQRIVRYGTHNGFVTGNVISSHPFLQVKISSGDRLTTIQTQLVGNYNLSNVLAAVTVGKYFKVPEQKIKIALENYQPVNSRSQLVKWKNNTVILDAYNANPSSMKVAIENLATMPVEHKWLILGGMMELGSQSIEEHQELIEIIKKYSWENVVLVGGDFNKTNHEYVYFDNVAQAAEWLNQNSIEHANILIKGSRSMKMEKVIN